MKISFCWLGEEAPLEVILIELFLCSKQQLKKWLTKEARLKIIHFQEEIRVDLDLVNNFEINPEYLGPDITILFENEKILAVHKPPFIHCHPHKYSDQNTVLNALIRMKRWDVLLTNKKNYDRGLLYRLDYETSGVLLLAKNQSTYDQMRGRFHEVMKEKFYLAIVEGDFQGESLLTHFLKPSGVAQSKQKCFDEFLPDSFQSHIHVEKILMNQNKSLLLIKLNEGHRHQIRAQLAHLGFPILGDELYGGVKEKRLYLHAYEYRGEVCVSDEKAELFDLFFNLNSAFQVIHNVSRIFKGR